ncbi:Nramp family divalent metal transporter [Acidithiobacillus sp. IBUN Pt1247-S3]|uniref:Nramp family divalent metal transporter n=1 Tax=Acidithiobacillus sp. IBUN Pt1247-S3 TaxID=3166642 RepID=UPI0034E4B7DA
MSKVRDWLKALGPGLITGGAGDDPSGIVTYSVVGATTGFSLLWLMLLSTPMMIAVQSIASRISIITEKSLPEIITSRFSRRTTIIVISALVIVNVITIGADLSGMATVLGILTGTRPGLLLIPVTVLIAYLVIFNTYRVVKTALLGLTLILVVYVISALLVRPNLQTLLVNTFVPHFSFSSGYVLAALGLLGTTISPYMLFWQAAEEREEKRSVVQAAEADFDTMAGMLYSNLVAYFIIVSAALVLYGRRLPIQTMRDVALALQPLGGEYTFALFSAGVLVAGFLAIPVLAGSSAYAIADTFAWREGMDYKVSDARGFYAVFLGSLLVGDLIYLSPVSTVDALYFSQVLDGVLLPFLVALLLILGNDKRIMGQHTNSWLNNVFGVLTLLVSLALSIILFYRLIF